MRAAAVKKAIEGILSNYDGHYVSDSVAAAIACGAAAAETSEESEVHGTTILPYSPQRNDAIGLSFQGKTIDAVYSSNKSKKFRDDVLQENAEAVFAACDTAHRRWAKLLRDRGVLHASLNPLQSLQFLYIDSINEDFIAVIGDIGGRLGYSIDGTVQSYTKAFSRYTR